MHLPFKMFLIAFLVDNLASMLNHKRSSYVSGHQYLLAIASMSGFQHFLFQLRSLFCSFLCIQFVLLKCFL